MLHLSKIRSDILNAHPRGRSKVIDSELLKAMLHFAPSRFRVAMFLPFVIVPFIFASERAGLPRTSGPTTGKLGLSLVDGPVVAVKVVYACELLVALLISADVCSLGDCSEMTVRIEA